MKMVVRRCASKRRPSRRLRGGRLKRLAVRGLCKLPALWLCTVMSLDAYAPALWKFSQAETPTDAQYNRAFQATVMQRFSFKQPLHSDVTQSSFRYGLNISVLIVCERDSQGGIVADG